MTISIQMFQLIIIFTAAVKTSPTITEELVQSSPIDTSLTEQELESIVDQTAMEVILSL